VGPCDGKVILGNRRRSGVGMMAMTFRSGRSLKVNSPVMTPIPTLAISAKQARSLHYRS
jgi:hypothetical protein